MFSSPFDKAKKILESISKGEISDIKPNLKPKTSGNSQYKIDILETLKSKGYTSYILRQQKLLSQSTIQKLRDGKGLAWDNIERICNLLNCQPGDILEYIPDKAKD